MFFRSPPNTVPYIKKEPREVVNGTKSVQQFDVSCLNSVSSVVRVSIFRNTALSAIAMISLSTNTGFRVVAIRKDGCSVQ